MKSLQEAKSVAREPYAWPGGYPRYLVTSDGGCLCPKCVRSEFRQIAYAAIASGDNQWLPLGSDINWEDPNLTCDHCGNQIKAAYSE